MGLKIPKVMIAAVKSGSGKTTVTCAFLKQLLCRKKHPVSFKCGPDYIDPMFHEQVLKIPSKNLDTFFSDALQIQTLYEMELPGHDIAVLEGVMGLYDGLGGIREEGSSYHLAKTLDVPVILVVDAHGMGKSVLPLIAGFLQYDEKKLIKGVILNRTSKMFFDTIAPLIEEELAIKALGCIPNEKELTIGSRHLGLILPEEMEELFALAKEHRVVLVEKLTLVYLRAFTQLVWLTHGALVGDVVAVKCAVSQDDFEGGKNFNETVSQALCACIKLLGKDYLEVNTNAVKGSDGEFIYDMITVKYPRALATIEIGTTVDVENELVIIGSKGRITVPNDWWNTGYFEAKVEGQEFLKRYSFNFEGNGLRYLLQELMIMIRDRRTECTRFFYEESETLAELLKTIDQRG